MRSITSVPPLCQDYIIRLINYINLPTNMLYYPITLTYRRTRMRSKIPSLAILFALFIFEIYHSIDPVSDFISGSRTASTILSLTFHALWFLLILAVTYKYISSKKISSIINSVIVAIGIVLIAIDLNRYNLGELSSGLATRNIALSVILSLILLNIFKDKSKI